MEKVLGYVDEFAGLYVEAALQWCKKEKIHTTDVTFVLGKAPYRFPPKMVMKQGESKRIIYSFELPYKNEGNYMADALASDINQYLETSPEYETQIIKRMNHHLLKIRNYVI